MYESDYYHIIYMVENRKDKISNKKEMQNKLCILLLE